MSQSGALFLTLAIAAGGFAALRLSVEDSWKMAFGGQHDALKLPLRLIAIVLLGLSAFVWVTHATSSVVGWMSWLFCVLPLAPLPLITIWPYRPRAAVMVPPLVLAFCAVWIV